MEPDHRNPVPPGWGDDHLSGFLDTAEQNRFATFVLAREAYKKLQQIDDLLMAPSLSVWRVADELSAPASLFHRCHGFYRAACSCAMAGQIAETFAMCRAVLEAAGYAMHMARNPGLDTIWINRHEEHGLSAVRNAFKISAVQQTIDAFDKATAVRFARLYQEAIDMGAHPNERSVSSSLFIKKLESEHVVRNLLLNPGGISQEHAMIHVARSGAVSLELLMEIFRSRFEELDGEQRFREACKDL
jgi:hypothetical protein